MKLVSFAQSGAVVSVKTEANVLQALLAEKVPVAMACGGRGICATCHVYVERGGDALTPRTKKEERTLPLIGESDSSSRLACQAKVLKDGCVVRLPKGLYVERSKDLYELIGRRAEARMLHPVDGRVLVAEGKIITRSMLDRLADVDVDIHKMMAISQNVTS